MASPFPDRSPGLAMPQLDYGIEVRGAFGPRYDEILTPDALRFLASLARRFELRRQELLERRVARQEQLDQGGLPNFLPETRAVRLAEWKVAPIPKDLFDRRVEITGPVERKMIINALNSGANVFMADFEDSNCPSWRNNLEGQINLCDAVDRTITYDSPAGKHYKLGNSLATLFVRPRGWHLDEKQVLVDARPISASLFDFGLYFYHNAAKLIALGSGPYFYLPKLESHEEARLWNDVFEFAQEELGIAYGTIRATVLIETIPAAFEMDEILYELRDHSAGLNCGRWDYIFSFIKLFRKRPDFVLPDRSQVTMSRRFLNAYVELLIKTSHRRGAHAMGGMAAQIPIKTDPVANDEAMEKVEEDKLREVGAGHDGTWVAHPGLVPIAREIFDYHMQTPNQIDRRRNDVHVSAGDLLTVPDGTITEHGLRHNIDVGLQYLEAWLSGSGCVPIYNLMEDAATAEISRSQVWQWVAHGARMADERTVTPKLVRSLITQELEILRDNLGSKRFDGGRFLLAAKLFEEMATSDELTDFMTIVAYNHID